MFIRQPAGPETCLEGDCALALCEVIRWRPRHLELRALGGRVCNHGVTNVSGVDAVSGCRAVMQVNVRVAVAAQGKSWARKGRWGDGRKGARLALWSVDCNGSCDRRQAQLACWSVLRASRGACVLGKAHNGSNGGSQLSLQTTLCVTSSRAAAVLCAGRWDCMQALEASGHGGNL